MKNLLRSALLIFCTLPLMADTLRLQLGYDDWPPFTGKPETPRVAIDLVSRALARIGVEADMLQIESGKFADLFTAERYHGSPALWRNPEREAQLVFSNPIYENRMVLLGRKGSGAARMELADLRGKKVGVVGGYAYGEEVENSGAVFVRGKSDLDNIVRMLNGEFELMLVNELLVRYAIRGQERDFNSHAEVGSHPITRRPLYFAVKKSVPGAEEIIRKFNEEMNRMLRDGSLHEILGFSWIVMDLDGDGKMELVFHGENIDSPDARDVYTRFSREGEKPEQMQKWFHLGGKWYASWEEVPDRFKRVLESQAQDVWYQTQGIWRAPDRN
jgi:polar amino acid transport system substrate-binding protein